MHNIEHLNVIKGYSKLLLKLIHPDKHHGFENIQNINALATSKVNGLFKLAESESSSCINSHHALKFYIWRADKSGHEEINYRLSINFPFDRISAKSALDLFKKVQIPVEYSLLEAFDSNSHTFLQKIYGISSRKKEQLDIMGSCLDFEAESLECDAKDVCDFLRSRPYIQFEGRLPENLSGLLRIGSYLSHIMGRFEPLMIHNMPIIILSEHFLVPEILNNVVKLPISTRFKGKESA
jgi:hypothetical protein